MAITLEDLERRVGNLESGLVALRRDHFARADQIQRLEEWMDTVSSPFYKRLYWWLSGWRFYRLGRWRR